MDPETLLDYALLKLTPTRTRCDLVIFSGGSNEKLASGLVEPFISHLKYAKDQLPKGGYSISLRPPSPDASWFSKATFQRLVRFISSPEILERFARLEKEILQIETSVQSSELSNKIEAHTEEGSLSSAEGNTNKPTDASKIKSGEADEIAKEENSKIRLQRHLETRKTLLRKEQAMAYARALVAGFEIDNLADLISFADSFGAVRLREACIEFKELCKKKHTDGLWIDELRAMAACSPSELAYSGTSGVLLTNESSAFNQNIPLNFVALVPNGSADASPDITVNLQNSEGNKDSSLPQSGHLPSTPANVQVQMPWLNQIPQYMYNFQGPQGQVYPYPSMQPPRAYYPAHMHWPPNIEESQRRHRKSSSKKKEKSPNAKETEASGDEEAIESCDSDSRSDSDSGTRHEKSSSSNKKYRKKPSKTVVIRNINYITSKRKDGDSDDSSSDENEVIDEESLKQRVDDVIGSLGKHQKSSKSHRKKKGSNSSPDHNLDLDLAPKKNDNWDAFQNLLMKDEESPRHDGRMQQQPMDVQDEDYAIKRSDDGVSFARNLVIGSENENTPMQRKTSNDSLVVPQRDEGDEGRVNSDIFLSGESFRPCMKGRDSADAHLLISQRLQETGSNGDRALSDFQPEASIIRNGRGEDWFVANANQDRTNEKPAFNENYVLSMEGNRLPSETRKYTVPIDDSFMVTRASLDDQYDSQWRTAISMTEDMSIEPLVETSGHDDSLVKVKERGTYEPDDLYMVVSRDSVLESGRASWTPEVDYGIGISFTKAEQKSAPVETNDQIVDEKLSTKNKSALGKKVANPGTKSKVLRASYPSSRTDMLSKTKRVPIASRPVVSKSAQEDEIRKRMEELAIERQKRIAERTAAAGATVSASKKVPLGSRMSATNSPKSQVASGQMKHKPGLNQLRK